MEMKSIPIISRVRIIAITKTKTKKYVCGGIPAKNKIMLKNKCFTVIHTKHNVLALF